MSPILIYGVVAFLAYFYALAGIKFVGREIYKGAEKVEQGTVYVTKEVGKGLLHVVTFGKK